jgi:hypothetical protein
MSRAESHDVGGDGREVGSCGDGESRLSQEKGRGEGVSLGRRRTGMMHDVQNRCRARDDLLIRCPTGNCRDTEEKARCFLSYDLFAHSSRT